jgi:two-component system response regulator YesN
MSIKVLIVDDEPIICQGLRQTIPWDTIGVEVVGEAYDGAEALQFVTRQHVDLVLTDIHMDGMDGLALAKGLKELLPQIRVIILSGYDDFEYARRALRLGIEDYLLKPVNIEELMAMVQSIGKELTHDAELEKKFEREQWSNWLVQLVQGSGVVQKDADIPPPFIIDGIHSFRFIASQLEDYYALVESSTDEKRQSIRKMWEMTVNTALKADHEEVISFFYHPNLLISLCMGSDPLSQSDLTAALLKAQSMISSAPRLIFGVSQPFSEIAEIYPRSMEAVSVLQLGAIPDSSSILFHHEELTSRRSHLQIAPIEQEKQLIHILFDGSYDDLEEMIGKIMQEFRERGYLLKGILQAFKELSIVLLRKLHMNGIDLSEHIDLFNTKEIDLFVHNSYRAMESLLRLELRSLYSITNSSLAGKNHWITERVKKFIDTHYHTDLKASEIAAWLKITPNYFSFVFKQNFGKGFAEYLNELRIERAKASLAGTDERVFEIAEKVGYKEYKYFCSIFKSFTGITPTQYRNLAKTNV